MGLQEQDSTNKVSSIFDRGNLFIWQIALTNYLLPTSIYDDVVSTLKAWKEQAKIPVYVGVGSADFLIMVLSNTIYGNILPYFNGHMNIMDFDGTRANKDFRKLANLLRLPPEKILYITRFRADCRRAIESGMQSLIVLRPDFDTYGVINQVKNRRGIITSHDGTKTVRPAVLDDHVSPPPGRQNQMNDIKNADLKKQLETNISSLSLIDDHEDTDRYNTQSSAIVEQDLTKYIVVLSLPEITFK